MQQTEPVFELKLQFSRRMIQIFRKRYPAPTIEESVQKAFEVLVEQAAPGVHISEKTLLEMATILASTEITSEAELIAFSRERFNISPTEVLIDLDPNLCFYKRTISEREKISFGQSASNYFHNAFAQGWFNIYSDLSCVSFTPKEWRRLKEILGKVPAVGISLLRILEDWKVRREASAVTAPEPKLQAMPPASPPKQSLPTDRIVTF